MNDREAVRIVHYYPTFRHKPSGVTAAITAWARATRAESIKTEVVDDWGNGATSMPSPGLPARQILHLFHKRASRIPFGLIWYLRRNDILYLHEGWVLSNIAAALFARLRRVRYVVMPHGVYERGIMVDLHGPLGLRRFLECWMLTGSLSVHLFFESEAELLHKVAPKAQYFVAPTGCDHVSETWIGGGHYLAWLGRIDVNHKGLDLLLNAIASCPVERRPLLRVHGYDYNGGVQQLAALVRRHRLEDHVIIGPALYGVEKDEFLNRAAAYVHPSRWECHSITLIECLSRGVPTIISDSIHIAGPLSEASAAALRNFHEVFPDCDWSAMDDHMLGARGRKFAIEALSWDRSIEKQLLGILPHLVNSSSRPDS